jgi:uncharacterized protein YndB with AHSA1/START domain
MKHEFVTAAVIGAAPAAVWSILTDAAGYASWNPEIVAIEGRFAVDSRIKAHVKLGKGAVRRVSLRVTAFDPPVSMEWTGGMPLGLFVGRRLLTVTPHDGGAAFRMLVTMTGPLASLMVKSTGDRQPEIDQFSAALKARAERPGSR